MGASRELSRQVASEAESKLAVEEGRISVKDSVEVLRAWRIANYRTEQNHG